MVGTRYDRDDSEYPVVNGQPSKKPYWDHMEQLRTYAGDYKSRLEEAGLLEDARRLAISESYAEIEALVVRMLKKLLPPRAG